MNNNTLNKQRSLIADYKAARREHNRPQAGYIAQIYRHLFGKDIRDERLFDLVA